MSQSDRETETRDQFPQSGRAISLFPGDVLIRFLRNIVADSLRLGITAVCNVLCTPTRLGVLIIRSENTSRLPSLLAVQLTGLSGLASLG